MTDYPRKTRPTLTIIGFPVDIGPDRHQPFPLHPYVACGDVHTPSREYNRAEPTAPLPPESSHRRRAHTPEELVIIRDLDKCRRLDKRPGMEPSTLAKATAATVVIAILYVLLLAWAFTRNDAPLPEYRPATTCQNC